MKVLVMPLAPHAPQQGEISEGTLHRDEKHTFAASIDLAAAGSGRRREPEIDGDYDIVASWLDWVARQYREHPMPPGLKGRGLFANLGEPPGRPERPVLRVDDGRGEQRRHTA